MPTLPGTGIVKCPRCGLVTFDDSPQCPRCKESFVLVRPLASGTLGGARHVLRDEPELRGKLRDRLHRARLDRRKDNENPMAAGPDPDAPDWFEPAPGEDGGLPEAALAAELAGGETSEEGRIVHDGLSPDEEMRGGAATADATDDEFEAGKATSDPDDAAEPEFTGEIQGFSDWREELRERLKRIRARREQERLADEAAAETAEPEPEVDEYEDPEPEELVAEAEEEAAEPEPEVDELEDPESEELVAAAEEEAAEPEPEVDELEDPESEELVAEAEEEATEPEPEVDELEDPESEELVAEAEDDEPEPDEIEAAADIPVPTTAGDFLDQVVPDPTAASGKDPVIEVELGSIGDDAEVDVTVDDSPDAGEDVTPLEDLILERDPEDLVVDLAMVDDDAEVAVNGLELQTEDTDGTSEPKPAPDRGWWGHEDLPDGSDDLDPLEALESIDEAEQEEALDLDATPDAEVLDPEGEGEPDDEVLDREGEGEPDDEAPADADAELLADAPDAEAPADPDTEVPADDGLFDWGDAAVIVADVVSSEPVTSPESDGEADSDIEAIESESADALEVSARTIDEEDEELPRADDEDEGESVVPGADAWARDEPPLDVPAAAIPALGGKTVPELDFEPDAIADAIEELPSPEVDVAALEPEAAPALEWDDETAEAEDKIHSSAGPIGERAAAVLCDFLVLLAIGSALVGVASSGAGVPFRQILASDALWLGLAWSIFAAGYSIFFVGSCGQTIGRMVMRLRVVSSDQFTVGFDRAAIRMVAWIVALLPLGAGLLPALRDPQRRALHDRLSKTRVVKA